jgi:hypothetical protein
MLIAIGVILLPTVGRSGRRMGRSINGWSVWSSEKII